MHVLRKQSPLLWINDPLDQIDYILGCYVQDNLHVISRPLIFSLYQQLNKCSELINLIVIKLVILQHPLNYWGTIWWFRAVIVFYIGFYCTFIGLKPQSRHDPMANFISFCMCFCLQRFTSMFIPVYLLYNRGVSKVKMSLLPICNECQGHC